MKCDHSAKETWQQKERWDGGWRCQGVRGGGQDLKKGG